MVYEVHQCKCFMKINHTNQCGGDLENIDCHLVLPNGTGPGPGPVNFYFPGSPGFGTDSAR